MGSVLSWILSILAVIIVGLVSDLLFSGTKMAKFIRSATACITVLLLLLPLPNLLKNGFSQESGELVSYTYQEDTGYLGFTQQYQTAALNRGIEEALKDDGIGGATATVTATFEGGKVVVSHVLINLENSVIDQKHEHINKYELVKGLVAKYVNIDKEKVTAV